MPRIRYHVAMSLDGYIAGPHGELDWILQDPAKDFGALFAQFDTFLIGRRTFDLMRRPGSPSLPPGSNAFVFSRTLPDTVAGATVVRDVSPDTIGAIRKRAKKDIWLFGGAELFRSFLKLALVDAVEVSVIPVLLGQGLQLLPQPAKQAQLRLTSHRVYPSGIVSLEYALVPQAA